MSRVQPVEFWIQHIFQGEGVPPFSGQANAVLAHTLDLNGSSRNLVRLILQDLGLTSQILRLANSPIYNHSGRRIMSVAHAIILLGWDRIRNMVSALRFIEHFAHRSAGLRELALTSVLSAIHARDLASAVGYPRPEEAYICGLFRNLGEVLVACHYPREHSQIIVAMEHEKIPERAACLRVLGFSWDEVGSRVAGGWNLPEQVQLAMKPPQAGGSSLNRCLASITNYGHELTWALHRKGAGLDTVHTRQVTDPAGHSALLPVRELRRIVDASVAETRETMAALRIPVETLRLERQAERARGVLASASVFGVIDVALLEQAIAGGAQELERESFEVTHVIAGLLDAVCASGFERAVFGLMTEDSRFLRGRLASGPRPEDVLERFQFPMDGFDGPLRAALQRQEDLYVDRERMLAMSARLWCADWSRPRSCWSPS